MIIPSITLKPGKHVPIVAGHPWIFSEAIAQGVDAEPGGLVRVLSASGEALGIGTWNPLTSIRVRLLTRDDKEEIDTAYFSRRFNELDTWKHDRLPAQTTGYRIVHAEADGLPGLILDRYDKTFVFQLHTAGMERLRPFILEALQQTFRPEVIVERSDLEVRKIEGLDDRPVAVHSGAIDGPVAFRENGLAFVADVLKGQKTGFFLDQRDARQAVGKLAQGKRVLNLFSYSGAFSVYAATSGAQFVASVDSSHSALELAQEQFRQNTLDPENESAYLFLEADVLDLLRDEDRLPGEPYDFIICDPPAFAKSGRQVDKAIASYIELNTQCFSRLSSGGILVTSSCSGRVSPDDFRSLLRIAAGRARCDVRVREWISQPIDHAERLSFPEGRYLKTAILEVI